MKSIRETEEKVQKTGPKSNKILINKDLLPSKGKYYEGDLYARKLSAIEMKELSKVTRDTVDRVFNSVISSAVDGIELSDIKRNDKLWLIYYLRSITYNDIPMKVQGECKSCGKKEWYDYRLMNLDVVYAEKELEKELVLPNGDTLELRFPTIGDEIEIARTKNNPAYIENIDADVMTVASHISSINGESVSIYEAYVYFARGKGSALDYARLVNHLKKYAFGARPYAKFQCGCGELAYAEVQLTGDFFLPEI
jgi:hypothetical protein